MDEQNELILEHVWIEPNTYVSYLDDVRIKIEFKNASDYTLEINKITCSLQAEDHMPRHESSITPHESIHPNNRSSTLTILIKIGLELNIGTNSPVFDVEYAAGRSARKKVTFGPPDTKYLIINPKHSPEKHFFLSHKDPKDKTIALSLDRHLEKIGFRGYVAENDPKPGLDIWDEKILPSIDDCVGMIVLWTRNAAKDPKSISKEIEYAIKKEKRVFLLAENGIDIPSGLGKTTEHITTGARVTDRDLVYLVNAIHDVYKQGGF